MSPLQQVRDPHTMFKREEGVGHLWVHGLEYTAGNLAAAVVLLEGNAVREFLLRRKTGGVCQE